MTNTCRRKLVRRLVEEFPGSAHIHECDLGAADDAEIWRYAAQGGFVIVSKDVDFFDLIILRGGPPKLLWLRTGNCSTAAVEDLLRAFAEQIRHFGAAQEDALLILP